MSRILPETPGGPSLIKPTVILSGVLGFIFGPAIIMEDFRYLAPTIMISAVASGLYFMNWISDTREEKE